MIKCVEIYLQLIAYSSPCPKYDKIYSEYMRNPPSEIQSFFQENEELYSYLTAHSGLVSCK